MAATLVMRRLEPSDHSCPTVDPRPGRWAGPSGVLALLLSTASCNAILGFDEGAPRAAAGGHGLTGTAAGTGGEGAAGMESCLDRVDNNGDGLADCEDPLCQASHGCVELPSGPWLGVGWRIDDPTSFACAHGDRVDLFQEADLELPSDPCSCSCEAPTDPTCTAALVCAYNGCHDAALAGAYESQADCTDEQLSTGAMRFCHVGGTDVVAGTCAVAAGFDDDPFWPPAASLCLYADAGHCGSDDQLCIPDGIAAAGGPCIAAAGEVPCPATYPARRLYWDGGLDEQRSCSTADCACGAATGAACACTGPTCGVAGFGGPGCAGAGTNLAPVDGSACMAFPLQSGTGPFWVSHELIGRTVTSPGSCAPSGTSTVTGSATPNGRITVCCAPSG